jgi:hypothetical protein
MESPDPMSTTPQTPSAFRDVTQPHNREGVPIEHCAMRCPMCDTIQSATDLIAAGAGKNFDEIEKYLGFSCVGRWTHEKPPPAKKGTQQGCNWTLGGLFRTHKLTVTTPDGKAHARFELCTPEEAQAHMKKERV